jgi:hypothetical protein
MGQHKGLASYETDVDGRYLKGTGGENVDCIHLQRVQWLASASCITNFHLPQTGGHLKSAVFWNITFLRNKSPPSSGSKYLSKIPM